MKKVFLPDVCRIQYGYPFDSTLFNDKEGTPLIRIRDIIRGYSETYTTEKVNEGFLVHPGDILIGMDGEFNVAKWGSIPSYLNQRVCRIFPQKNIDSEYLFHYLPVALKKIEEKTPFVTVKHLSAKALSTIPVPICELSEQRRKSQFLSSICFLVELRKKQLSLLGQLASSRFIELFGKSQYPVKTIKSVCKIVTDGTHQPPRFTDSGIPFLFVSNIVENALTYETSKFITEKDYSELIKRTPIELGDLLLSIVGSYGNPAIVRSTKPFCLYV